MLPCVFRQGGTYPEMLGCAPSLSGDPRDCDRRCPWARELRLQDLEQEEGLLSNENSLRHLHFFYHSLCTGFLQIH